MKNFLIPALAFVSAIGMSFTTANQQESDYIRVDDQWEAIPEINCSPQSDDCLVTKGGEGPFVVYDTMDLNSEKEGDASITVLP